MTYDRAAAVEYAHRWAYGRNPKYMNFSGIGGDCTNFVSQCLHAGGAPMNYTPTFGWYYRSPGDRAPAWTGVQYLYNFLIVNQSAGPRARRVEAEELEPGDVVQLAFTPGIYAHSLLVVEMGTRPAPEEILIATHSDDSDNRPLSSYHSVAAMRFLKISLR